MTGPIYVLFIVATVSTAAGPVERWERIDRFEGADAMGLCRANGMRIAERRNAESGRRPGPFRAHCEWISNRGTP